MAYDVYTFNLTQQGTNDPVAVVRDNTLGGEVVWTRIGPLEFEGTLAGAFPDRLWIQPRDIMVSAQYQVSCYRINDDKIGISITHDGALYTGVDFEIRVYPE